MSNKTFAVIVTYNPDNLILDDFIASLKNQVSKIIIIDNSESSIVNDYKDVDVIRLNANLGIAEAQNLGIQKVINEGGEFVFTFDQDSKISDTYCNDMIFEYDKNKKSYKIACLGPVINQQPISDTLVEKDFVISSGALFPVQMFKHIGMFKAEWFIDMIDVEWSYRARTKGFRTFETSCVSMRHNIGENNYPKFLRWEVRIGAPVRQYYLVRNWFFSLKSESFDLRYKFYIILLLLKKIPLFLLLAPRRERAKFIILGILDGITGKGGKYSH